MKLTNSVALVTGGSSGIGRAIAVEAAKRGMRVLASVFSPSNFAAIAAQFAS